MRKGRSQNRDSKDSKSKGPRSNRGKQYHGSKGNKGGGRESKQITEATEGSTNDPAWYSQSPELLRDSSSIPFSWPVGTSINEGPHITNDRVPGVMSMELLPTLGTSTNQNDPANVASNAIYSFVRHANSGHSNYDAPDMMIYLLAMSSIYSFITWCQRLLGLVMTYDQRNRYIPEAVFRACGADYWNMRTHIADFRFWLNTLITKVASFAIPNTMPYFSRMAFLYSNFYSDGPSIKDQLYLYAPAGSQFLKFQLDSNQKGELIYYAIPGGGLSSFTDIVSYGDALFNAIWQEEDFGIMSGDILKAYGDNIIKLSMIPEDFAVAPVYDPMFLHQFKNAKLVSLTALSVSSIKQDSNGNIVQSILIDGSNQWAKAAAEFAEANKILSSDFDAPTPEVVIESTRLMAAWDSGNLWYDCGSEIPVTLRTWYYDNTGTLQNIYLDGPLYNGNGNPVGVAVTVGQMMNFRYAPEIWIILTTSSGGYNIISDAVRIWDINNYAVLSNDDLEKMHSAALMSMLAVPSIGKIQ